MRKKGTTRIVVTYLPEDSAMPYNAHFSGEKRGAPGRSLFEAVGRLMSETRRFGPITITEKRLRMEDVLKKLKK